MIELHYLLPPLQELPNKRVVTTLNQCLYS
jgi:hypothetical protein